MKSSSTGIGIMTALLILILASAHLHAETPYKVTIPPKADDNFTFASFSLLVPRKVDAPRYILVLLPGFNGDGRGFLQHQRWKDFAEKTGGAMVACTFRALPEETPKEIDNYVHYAAAQHGSGTVLESAIEKLDEMDSVHSLRNLPLLIYGHSAGGQFAYGFSCHNPKRMIGFAAVKGGYYYPEPIEGTYKVPGLVISGEQDLIRRRIEIRTLFESHRKHGAPWCWMEDDYGHGVADTLDVVLPYFMELIRMRLPAGSKTLQAITKDAGVAVDLRTKSILEDGAIFFGESVDLGTAFLPSADVFKVWARHDTGKRKYFE